MNQFPGMGYPQDEHNKDQRLRLSLTVYLLSAIEQTGGTIDEHTAGLIVDQGAKLYTWIVGSDGTPETNTIGGQYL